MTDEKNDEKATRITITIKPSLLAKAKKDAEKEERSLSNYISYLLSQKG